MHVVEIKDPSASRLVVIRAFKHLDVLFPLPTVNLFETLGVFDVKRWIILPLFFIFYLNNVAFVVGIVPLIFLLFIVEDYYIVLIFHRGYAIKVWVLDLHAT